MDINIKELKKALEFYANEDNYFFNAEGRGILVQEDAQLNAVSKDLGELARKALYSLED